MRNIWKACKRQKRFPSSNLGRSAYNALNINATASDTQRVVRFCHDLFLPRGSSPDFYFKNLSLRHILLNIYGFLNIKKTSKGSQCADSVIKPSGFILSYLWNEKMNSQDFLKNSVIRVWRSGERLDKGA